MTEADPPQARAAGAADASPFPDLETLRQDQARALEDDQYRAIFTHALEGIFQSTPDGRFITVNPAMAAILGYESPQELIEGITDIGRQLYVEPAHREELRRRLREQGAVVDFVSQAYRKDGQIVWTRGNVRAVTGASGEILYYEGTFADITEQKRLEEQLRQAQKMEAVGRLAGGIAHDFNNLLAVIRGYSDVLRARPGLDGETQELLEEIQRAANRASVLTRQLLTFSRKQTFKTEVIALNQIVTRAEGLIRRVLGDRHALYLLPDPRAGAVRIDAGQLEQALLNLAINARDAMPAEGSLTVSTYRRDFRGGAPGAPAALENQCCAVLEVKDTGQGMDPEIVSQIWEPFFTTKPAEHGTGLGLSMVYGFVEQSGGFIEVESAPGQGTTFRIFLPAIELPAAAAVVPFEPLAKPPGSGTVLLVEDEDAVRGVVQAFLIASGFQVLTASGGDEAVTIYQTHPGRIDLVLTDLIMPGGSGSALALQLRRIRPEIPILYMTGHSNQEVERLGISWSAPDLLHKPFPRQELVERIGRALQGSPPGIPKTLLPGIVPDPRRLPKNIDRN